MCITKFRRLKLNFTPEIKISLLLCAPGKSESESGHQMSFPRGRIAKMANVLLGHRHLAILGVGHLEASVASVSLSHPRWRNRGCAGGSEPGTASHDQTQSFARNQQDHHQHEGARAEPAGRRHLRLLLRRPLHPQREGGRGPQCHRGRRWVNPCISVANPRY